MFILLRFLTVLTIFMGQWKKTIWNLLGKSCSMDLFQVLPPTVLVYGLLPIQNSLGLSRHSETLGRWEFHQKITVLYFIHVYVVCNFMSMLILKHHRSLVLRILHPKFHWKSEISLEMLRFFQEEVSLQIIDIPFSGTRRWRASSYRVAFVHICYIDSKKQFVKYTVEKSQRQVKVILQFLKLRLIDWLWLAEVMFTIMFTIICYCI